MKNKTQSLLESIQANLNDNNITVEESVTILHHHGGTGWDSNPDNTPQVFNRYTLPVLLHCADLIATYEDEKN